MNHRPSNSPLSAANPRNTSDVDVLVVGAGPTGLTAACEALRLGLSVRIIDHKPGRSTHSKALVTHARTMEVFAVMGVADAMLAKGVPFAALNVYAGSARQATRVDLLGLPWGDTAYPYWLSIPQDATEQVLEDHLSYLGGAVEWGTSLDQLRETDRGIEALMQGEGDSEKITSRWLVGCDGGRSRVRDQVGLRLQRRDAGATFVLADVKSALPIPQDEGRVHLDPDGLLLVVPMPEVDRWRIIAHVPTQAKGTRLRIDAGFLDDLIRQRTGLEFGSHDVTWTSQFNLSHGLVDHYRKGSVFLAGDAAHVHSPVGGQGLNAGVQDAHNLIWKLSMVDLMASPEAAEELLDSYEQERRPTARSMVNGVARVTAALTTRRSSIRRVVGRLSPWILRRPAVQAKLGRTAGMLELAYSSGSLSSAKGAGQRLSNPRLPGGGRLYGELPSTGWCWVVWGRAGETRPDVDAACWRGMPVVFLVFEIQGTVVTDISPDNRVLLIRPDRYVAGSGSTPEAIGHHGSILETLRI
ncbi:FAD-dependent monooxygenase [Arthrobacter sp. E3]|uniref:FAD-dependent monooxygenase n=1 Tax=Arthrobacter sp. E3 TaxID=517402 RepID=UPI001A950A1E|nr:FAD-dependent monooxygenase [Arthrobacter sp. E3]